MPRTATTFGAAALVALLLAGCTTPDPTPTDPGSTAQAPSSPAPSATESSPAASPTPVVIAPERPAAMDDEGYQGAEAAAEYFLLLDSYIMKTGDTAEWEAMSHDECGYCTRRLEQAKEIDEYQHTWSGGDTSVDIEHTYEQDEPTGIWPIDASISVKEVTVTAPDGEAVFHDEATDFKQRIEIVQKGAQWKVIGVSGLEDK